MADHETASAGRHVLLTGGSSGIGLQAASQLLAAGHQLTVVCRDSATANRLQHLLDGDLKTLILDLADLESVARGADSLIRAAQPIDSLVLNAGLQYSGAREPRWSVQGYELTLAVNHLAHQALLQRLLPLLLQADEPRLVITASEVHDPASAGGRVGRPADLGDLAGLRKGPGATMVDGGPFHAEKAYKDSKLCNVLMARQVARQLSEQSSSRDSFTPPVIAWSPGLVIPRSEGGFFRESRRHNPVGQALFAFVARDLLRVTETPQRAGALLAGLASGSLGESAGFQYWSNRVICPGQLRFSPTPPSAAARSDALAAELWRVTAEVVELGREEKPKPSADCGRDPLGQSQPEGPRRRSSPSSGG